MATEYSDIDSLLMSQSGQNTTTTPETPEHQDAYSESHADNSSDTYDDSDSLDLDSPSDYHDSDSQNDEIEAKDIKENETDIKEYDTDEYGNEKTKPRMYTEEEHRELVNKAVRERLARGNHNANQQPAQQQQQFNYNPESEQSWEQQLEQFVEQTVSKMTQKQIQQQQALQEQLAEQEFSERFIGGMERFQDFKDVVGSQNITDPMTLALRGVQDPSAFIYAAAKRHPAELERISKLKDPYSQMVEMGKLEERMRKKPEGTKAPRPVSRTQEDSSYIESKKKGEPTIEDMIAQFESKRIAKFNRYHGNNRR